MLSTKKFRRASSIAMRQQAEQASLMFTYSQTGDIWVSLIEKAFAKIYGSYWDVGEGGHGYEALMDLTGAPCEMINIAKLRASLNGIYVGEEESCLSKQLKLSLLLIFTQFLLLFILI